ncbi:unnamed protein product, partial [marine sediment metagenome]
FVLEPISDQAVDELITLWIITSLKKTTIFFDSVYRNLPSLILANPTVESVGPGLGFFLKLVLPFYILGILLTALYLLFLSGSPAGRSMAKGNLLKLIYSLILLSLSPSLLELLFFLSSSVTSYVMSVVDIEIALGILERATDGFYAMIVTLFGIWVKAEGAGGFFAASFSLTYYILYILIIGRFVFVTLFAMLLPLSMFLYSFYSTRVVGRTLFRQLLILTFIQVTWGIALVAIAIGVPSLYTYKLIP